MHGFSGIQGTIQANCYIFFEIFFINNARSVTMMNAMSRPAQMPAFKMPPATAHPLINIKKKITANFELCFIIKEPFYALTIQFNTVKFVPFFLRVKTNWPLRNGKYFLQYLRSNGQAEKSEQEKFYTTIRLHPRKSAASNRPDTSKLPSGYTFPTSSVAIKEQE
jgi:hypothetical protein